MGLIRIGFSVAGAAIGTYFGGAQGARLGYAVGNFVGGEIDPNVVRSAGPQLGDLTPTVATNGSPIKIGYGTFRVGANPIWMSDITRIEIRETNQSFGSGTKTVQTTYEYLVSMAVSIAEGPTASLLRIWIDNKLVYDKRSTSSPVSVDGTLNSLLTGRVAEEGLNFRFYKGDEIQLPDPTMEAAEGVGNISAHRGMSYIVFKDLNITKYGNRPPTIEVEVAFTATPVTNDRFSDDFTSGEGGLFTTHAADGLTVDYKRRRIYVVGGGPSGSGLGVYNLDTLKEINQILYTDMVVHPRFSGGITQEEDLHIRVDDGDFIYIQSGTSNSRPIIRLDADTLKENVRFGFSGSLNFVPSTGPVNTLPAVNMMVETTSICPSTLVTGSFSHYLFCRSVANSERSLFVVSSRQSGMGLSFEHDFTNDIIGIVALPAKVNKATANICTQLTVNGDIDIFEVELGANASTVIDAADSTRTYLGVDNTAVDTIPSSTWNDDGNTAAIVTIDKSDNGLIFLIGRSSSPGVYIFKWIKGKGVVWVSQTNSGTPANRTTFMSSSNIRNNLIGWTDGTTFGEASLVDTRDGTVVVDNFVWNDLTPAANPIGQQFYDGATQSVIGIHSGASGLLGQLFLERADGEEVTDGAIILDVSARVGYDVATEINATELTHGMGGYAITRPMTARAAIQPLGTAFFTDAVESDGKIVFKNRGRAATRTIDDSEMISIEDNNASAVVETRMQEVELAEEVTVSYMDPATDYDIGAQSTKRILLPNPAMRSRHNFSVDLPIVMTADQARQISEKVLFTMWNERTNYRWRTPWENLDLDPADVVNLTLNGAITRNVRARISNIQVDQDLAIEFSGFQEELESVISTAAGGVHQNFPQQVIPGPSFTRLFLLDIPLVIDVDDIGRVSSRLRIAMNGYSANWPGGTLFNSSDAQTYVNTGLVNVTGVSYGTVSNKLPSTDIPFQTDFDTQLRVVMNDGVLSSVSQTDFLNNVNIAVVGTPGADNWEIILFRDVTQDGSDVFTLNTIMRGRRGTDGNVNKHTTGEFFIVLDLGVITSYFLALSTLDTEQFYKGKGDGLLLEAADTVTLASQMNDLKPYSPVHITAVEDGGNNIDITWVRRTRVGGAEPEAGSDDTPLSEDTESYEVDVGFFDEHYDKTILIVTANGVDAATATTDFSPKAHSLVFGTDGAGSSGEVELDTAQFKFGTASIKFANSGSVNPADAFVSAPGVNFSLFDKLFTLECWVRFNSTTGGQVFMSQYLNTGDERGWWFHKLAAGDLAFSYTTNGQAGTTVDTSVTWGPAINTWYHVAVTRGDDDNMNFFIDGQRIGGATSFGGDEIHNSSALFHIGKLRSTDDLPMNGWIDDARITMDVNRYTDLNGFTPMQIAESETEDVLRTLTSVVQSVQYDNADITTDFGSVPADIQLRAYQMSAQVGRGFGRTAKIVF